MPGSESQIDQPETTGAHRCAEGRLWTARDGAAIDADKFRAVIDRRYPMDEVVEAHRYVEAWHKAGNVVLTIATDSSGL